MKKTADAKFTLDWKEREEYGCKCGYDCGMECFFLYVGYDYNRCNHPEYECDLYNLTECFKLCFEKYKDNMLGGSNECRVE